MLLREGQLSAIDRAAVDLLVKQRAAEAVAKNAAA
jgi:hypothetical protein